MLLYVIISLLVMLIIFSLIEMDKRDKEIKELKEKKNVYEIYPCNNYLNNAIRFIHKRHYNNAISEIIECIERADGFIFDDVKAILKEREERSKSHDK